MAHDSEGAVMVDATLGLGGHTEAVLTRCELARVVGIDRDPAALDLARARLAGFGDRFTGVHAVYDELPDVLDDLGLDAVDAVLFDLGVSSMQLDVRERGFAYAEDAPLDMRMDGTTGPTAADVLNTYSADGAGPRAPGLRRGAVRAQDRGRRRPPARGGAVHDLGPPGRAAVRRDPGAGAAHRRPSGQAHVPGAADGGQRRARGAAPGHPRRHRRDPRSAAGWSSSPTTRSRTGWSSRPSPRSPGRLSPPDLPVVPEELQPALPPGHPRRRAGRRRRDRQPTRAPPRSGCAPSNASSPPTGAAA